MAIVNQFVIYGLSASGTSIASLYFLGTSKLAKDYTHELARYYPNSALLSVALTAFVIFLWHNCPCPANITALFGRVEISLRVSLYTTGCLVALAFRNFMNFRDRNNVANDAPPNVVNPPRDNVNPPIGIAADVHPPPEEFLITEPAAEFIIIPDVDHDVPAAAVEPGYIESLCEFIKSLLYDMLNAGDWVPDD
ncbi:hypothetical protein V6N13_088274 [Hibiscus sabdariffa]|uniref:Uncharacterized protein n=1 Tax=Hibiscus sabdariffa TaxID=183260 RepID=A0ABR2FZ13_9ROSI